jgi:hypothetical protein
MGLGLLQVSHAHAAGGGRTQPRVAPASPTFVRAIAWHTNGKAKGPFLQDCMRTTCAVYRADGGTAFVFKLRHGAWRVASMIGGESGAYRVIR